MATRIRLARFGSKQKPVYRVIVTDSRNRRDGAFIERLGWYDPRGVEKEDLRLDIEKIDAWLAKGAQPSETVVELIRRHKRATAS